jgi:release factor glutamine methyltransferase
MMRVARLPGVFRPLSDSWLLAAAARAAPQTRGGRVLDLCTGSGAVAISAALAGARSVTAVDVSRRAAWTVRLNARLNGVRVDVRRGDLLAAVAGERFDVICANPPYLPATPTLPGGGDPRHTEAGPAGRAVLDRIIAGAPAHLRPGGVLLVIHSSVNGEGATLERMRAAGLEPAVEQRRHGPLGPLLAARAPLLEDRGLLEPGQREEQLLVIRGVR